MKLSEHRFEYGRIFNPVSLRLGRTAMGAPVNRLQCLLITDEHDWSRWCVSVCVVCQAGTHMAIVAPSFTARARLGPDRQDHRVDSHDYQEEAAIEPPEFPTTAHV